MLSNFEFELEIQVSGDGDINSQVRGDLWKARQRSIKGYTNVRYGSPRAVCLNGITDTFILSLYNFATITSNSSFPLQPLKYRKDELNVPGFAET